MATMIRPTAQSILLDGVSWATYECLVADFGDTHAARMAYDQGKLEIMAPSYVHERLSGLLATLITVIATEMDHDFENAGATTFRREDIRRGFEPDCCFYLEHVAAIRGKRHIDLTIDPPPDLVVEVDITPPSLEKFVIYAALGVPEVWRCTEDNVILYALTREEYHIVETSRVLPQVTSNDLRTWLSASDQMSRAAWMRQIQAWARQRCGGTP